MSNAVLGRFLSLAAIVVATTAGAFASGQPVRESHPRLLMDSTVRTKLIDKKNANDPTWTALKGKADKLKGYPIEPFKYSTRYNWYNNRIYYGYQGVGWYESVMPLALAYQMTGDTAYSDKLMDLADELIRAESDPDNMEPNGTSPIRVNISYASRYVAPTIAIIYDWCYDRLGSTRKSQMIDLMNIYFDSLRSTYNYRSYENNGPSVGNFFGGHLFAVAYMGYATYGDNPRAQQMIDWARIRFDGTSSALLTSKDIPTRSRVQAFEGPYPAYFERARVGSWNTGTGAPFKGGFNFQGWSYGPNEFIRMVDYMLTVRTATGEDLIAQYGHWYTGMFRSMKHALYPNRITIDPVADWGGNQGAVISRSLPARLAYTLANTTDSAAAQYFVYNEIPQNSTYGYYAKDVTIYPILEWEAFFFNDPNRTATEGNFPLYYGPFGTSYTKGATGNGAMPRFIWRSGWDTSATWGCAEMGVSFYGDHQMHQAGHIYVTRGRDALLISPANWRGTAPGMGVIGDGIGYVVHSSVKNTLFFDDYGDYQRTSVDQHGGQSYAGVDRVIASEQTDDRTYVRSDLSTAYNNFTWPRTIADTVNRRLEHFYRTVLYLRQPNLMVAFDQVRAKSSTNPKGEYEKHLRWHFPIQPVVSGKSIKVQHSLSKMYMHTLLPTNAAITTVSLANNPDNRWGSSFAYAFNSPTWRAEVRDPANPLDMPFLTVMQIGDTTMSEMATGTIYTNDSSMIGSHIISSGAVNYVLFNNRVGAAPQEITSTSYLLLESNGSTHTLGGMVPNAGYDVTVDNDVVTVERNDSGAYVSSAAGVLQFELGSGNTAAKPTTTQHIVTGEALSMVAFPNPASDRLELRFVLPSASEKAVVSLFDAAGNRIATLADEPGVPGEHVVRVDLRDSNLATLADGAYYCRLETDNGTITSPVVIVR